MNNIQIENVIDDLIFIRSKLYNGIFGERSTPALTNAISLLRELQALKTGKALDHPTEKGGEQE